MTKTDIAKKVASLIVGMGTSKIVKEIIKNNITPTKKIDVVTVFTASWVLGSMVADLSKKYTDQKIDDLIRFYNGTVAQEVKDGIENAKTEIKEKVDDFKDGVEPKA